MERWIKSTSENFRTTWHGEWIILSSLPPGVTDSMCEGNDDPCARCGHVWSVHLDEEDYVYDAEGYVVTACNSKYCDGCEGYLDGEYEPEVFQEYD